MEVRLQALLSAAPAPSPKTASTVPGLRPPPVAEAPANTAPAELEDASVSAPVEDAPVFPDEETEMAMRSELRARGEAVEAKLASAAEPEDAAPLPPLDQLVSRLSPDVREVLDELFRARFTAVRRVPARALKESAAKGETNGAGARS